MLIVYSKSKSVCRLKVNLLHDLRNFSQENKLNCLTIIQKQKLFSKELPFSIQIALFQFDFKLDDEARDELKFLSLSKNESRVLIKVFLQNKV